MFVSILFKKPYTHNLLIKKRIDLYYSKDEEEISLSIQTEEKIDTYYDNLPL